MEIFFCNFIVWTRLLLISFTLKLFFVRHSRLLRKNFFRSWEDNLMNGTHWASKHSHSTNSHCLKNDIWFLGSFRPVRLLLRRAVCMCSATSTRASRGREPFHHESSVYSTCFASFSLPLSRAIQYSRGCDVIVTAISFHHTTTFRFKSANFFFFPAQPSFFLPINLLINR